MTMIYCTGEHILKQCLRLCFTWKCFTWKTIIVSGDILLLYQILFPTKKSIIYSKFELFPRPKKSIFVYIYIYIYIFLKWGSTVCIYLKNHDPPICPICTVLSSLDFIFWKICKLHALLTFFYKLLLSLKIIILKSKWFSYPSNSNHKQNRKLFCNSVQLMNRHMLVESWIIEVAVNVYLAFIYNV